MGGIRKLCLVAAVGLLVGLASLGNVAAAPKWRLYGDAMFVKEGIGDDPWALQLRSTCPGGPGDWGVSYGCFFDGTLTYGGVIFTPPGEPLHFMDIWHLGTDYNMKLGCFGGGAPRFTVALDWDADGALDWNVDKSVYVYLGSYPSFTDCPTGWQATGDLTESSDLRVTATSIGGAWYDTWANALTLAGSKTVLYVFFDLDGGWAVPGWEQTILVDNLTVNEHVLSGHGAV